MYSGHTITTKVQGDLKSNLTKMVNTFNMNMNILFKETQKNAIKQMNNNTEKYSKPQN